MKSVVNFASVIPGIYIIWCVLIISTSLNLAFKINFPRNYRGTSTLETSTGKLTHFCYGLPFFNLLRLLY